MAKPYHIQPLVNHTVYITDSGKFCIRSDKGAGSVNGQPSLSDALDMARRHFGMALSFRGTVAGPKIIDGVEYAY